MCSQTIFCRRFLRCGTRRKSSKSCKDQEQLLNAVHDPANTLVCHHATALTRGESGQCASDLTYCSCCCCCCSDLVDRGVRGIVLEAFGVGNMPDLPVAGWIPWLRQQTKKGLQVSIQCMCVCVGCHRGVKVGDVHTTYFHAMTHGVRLAQGRSNDPPVLWSCRSCDLGHHLHPELYR